MQNQHPTPNQGKDQNQKFRVLVLGVHGMLGHTLFTVLKEKQHHVIGTVRKDSVQKDIVGGLIASNQHGDIVKFEKLIETEKPDFVINCIGIVKQLNESKAKAISISINSLWPQILQGICNKHGSQLIHFSTDCVFSGAVGNYKETDLADSRDIYGLSKYMGEVEGNGAITLRTSIVGHELNSSVSLFDWFLSQKDSCRGFEKAMYSGLTTYEVAQFLDKYLFSALKEKQISGVYHLSSDPINKFDLLKIVARVYGKEIEIKADTQFVIDRTLDSSRLKGLLGYTPPSWGKQVEDLFQYYQKHHEKILKRKLD